MQEVRYRGKLKSAIADAGMNQRAFAKRVGEDESVISRVITGQWTIDPLKKAIWAAHLGRKPEDVFGDN